MRKILFLCMALSVSGCTHTGYDVFVDSMAAKKTNGAKVLVIDNVYLSASELEKQYYKNLIKRSLSVRGHTIVGDIKQAEYVVVFSYAMKGEHRIASKPTFQWVPPKQYDFSATSTNQYGSSYSTSGQLSESGIGQLQQSGSEVYSYNEYTKVLEVVAYSVADLENASKEKKNTPETWIARMVSVGKSNDARTHFPILLTAGARYFGYDSKGVKKEYTWKPDPRLFEIVEESAEAVSRPPASIP